MSTVFQLYDGWYAMWQGQLSTATFNCKGAAQAWVSLCNEKGKYIS